MTNEKSYSKIHVHMNAIEQGRKNLRELESIRENCRQIFEGVRGILEEQGSIVAGKTHIQKYKHVSHTVNSAYPPIDVEFWAGEDLNKARSIHMWIRGVGELRVHRKRINSGKETFHGQLRNWDSAYWSGLEGRLIGETQSSKFLQALRQIKEERGKPQASN